MRFPRGLVTRPLMILCCADYVQRGILFLFSRRNAACREKDIRSNREEILFWLQTKNRFHIMKVEFEKYEGAGNDFVVIDNRDEAIIPSPELVSSLCDRRFGIGADGMMLLEGDAEYDFGMRYFNSDGPEATMCGNGGRCMALFARNIGATGPDMVFSAVDGVHRASILSCSGEGAVISLEMVDVSHIDEMEGGYFVETGSPHYVVFVNNADAVNVLSEGKRLRHMEAFKGRGGVNVNFVEVAEAGVLKIRTYERGVENETLACGTGAVAAAVAASYARFPGKEDFEVHAAGGELNVSFSLDGGAYRSIVLTGPARRVFRGVFDTENF